MPLRRAYPHLPSAIVLERLGPLTHQPLWLALQSRRIQGLLQMIPDQEAAQGIGTLPNLVLQRLKVLRARHPPRSLLELAKLIEDFLYVPGIIGILTGRLRTHHLGAPA